MNKSLDDFIKEEVRTGYMKPVIGFAGNGHLMEYSASAAFEKGFKRTTYTPVKTGDAVEDFSECDIVYICPDRPSNITPQAMVDLVKPHLKQSAILVIHCQVEPGFTRKINWPVQLLYYHVETLKVNNEALERALNPERIIIGGANISSIGNIPAALMTFLNAFNCPIIRMNYESAELTKIALNIYLAAQLCTTNTLSEIADKIGADWNDIIPALQTDKRIGKEAYLKPGYGVGPHIKRDLREIQKFDINTSVTDAFLEHSEYRETVQNPSK